MSFAERKLHFIGIGGAGMSGLAVVAQRLGAAVSGSDRSDSPYLTPLRALGVAPVIGHDAANLPDDAEVVVSTAIAQDNPELARARELGLKISHRSDLLAEFAALKRCIAVSGTHGKTTTTAMIAHALGRLGADPAYFIGGEPIAGAGNAHWGAGEWVVIEADESDRSLLRLAAEICVVTNLELDHHATYGSIDSLRATFREFLASARQVVVWLGQDLPALVATAEVVGYRIDAPGVRPAAIARHQLVARDLAVLPQGTAFQLDLDGLQVAVELAVPGEHNVLNALAAIGACAGAGFDPAEVAHALKSFNGVGRRFEPKGTFNGARLFDDYAHHPTEVEATLKTAADLAHNAVIAVFQPHLFSRTQALAVEFGRALALADKVVVLDVYPAREQSADFPGVDGRLIARAAAAAARGKTVVWAPSQERALEWLSNNLRRGDVCLTIGAGDVHKIAEELAARSGDAE